MILFVQHFLLIISSISSPTIWHEENGAVIHAKLVSNGGHYADQQARYDWLTF